MFSGASSLPPPPPPVFPLLPNEDGQNDEVGDEAPPPLVPIPPVPPFYETTYSFRCDESCGANPVYVTLNETHLFEQRVAYLRQTNGRWPQRGSMPFEEYNRLFVDAVVMNIRYGDGTMRFRQHSLTPHVTVIAHQNRDRSTITSTAFSFPQMISEIYFVIERVGGRLVLHNNPEVAAYTPESPESPASSVLSMSSAASRPDSAMLPSTVPSL